MSPTGQRRVLLALLALVGVVGCASANGPVGIETDGPSLGSGEAGSTMGPADTGSDGTVPQCGNGQVEEGEDCDDGNADDTDDCTMLCTAPACDDERHSGDESDVDCGGSCDPCELGQGCTVGADCQTGVCVDDVCVHPIDCRDLLEQVPDSQDGVVTIDPDGEGGVAPFDVSCDMNTDGGGWIRLSLQHSDGVVVGQNGADNPWHKCEDDGAQHFAWIDEGTISADFSPGANFDEEVALSYQNPADGTVYDSAEVSALRSVVSQVDPTTRMVALTADDDGMDWHGDMTGGGHEVYVRGDEVDWVLLTPGTNGECGGSTDYPAVGSESAFYLWSSEADASEFTGDTGLAEGALEGLPSSVVLPAAVRLVVQTGGGVAFGWEQTVFRVR